LVGDPLQLSPTISGPHTLGLEKTMFDRLEQHGVEPILLSYQYRVSFEERRNYSFMYFFSLKCHPIISSIANDLFYQKKLMNGVTELDRPPLLHQLPVLSFIDVGCGKVSWIVFFLL
jgi:superfamily I DNA and/or RNA helicase